MRSCTQASIARRSSSYVGPLETVIDICERCGWVGAGVGVDVHGCVGGGE